MAGNTDGQVVIKVDLSSNDAEKELSRLKKKFLSLEEDLTVGQHKKDALTKKLELIDRQIDDINGKKVEFGGSGISESEAHALDNLTKSGSEIDMAIQRQNKSLEDTQMTLDGVKLRYEEVKAAAEQAAQAAAEKAAAEQAAAEAEKAAAEQADSPDITTPEQSSDAAGDVEAVNQGLTRIQAALGYIKEQIRSSFDFSHAKEDLKSLLSMFGSMVGKIAAGAEKITFNVAKKGVSALASGLKSCASHIGKIFTGSKSISRSFGGIGSAVKQIAPALIATEGVIGILRKAVNAYMQQNQQLANTLNSAWTGLGNILGPIIDRMVNLLANAIAYFTKLLNLLGFTGKTASKQISGAGAALKEAGGYLTGLDEINKMPDSGGGSAAGGTVAPEIPDDLSQKLQALADKIKKLIEPLQKINFTPLRKSLDKLKNSFKKLGDAIGPALEWAWENILVPLAEWTIEKGLPALIEAFADAFDFLGEVLDVLQPAAEWLWENFLQPIGEWYGNGIIATLETLEDLFDWLGGWIEDVAKGAKDAYDAIVKKWGEIASWWMENVSTPLKEKAASLGDAIPKSFADAREKVNKAWNTVSSWFGANVTEPLKTKFSDVRTKIPQAFSNAKKAVTDAWGKVRPWFENTVAAPVKNTFSSVKSSISNAFTNAKTAVTTDWGNVKTWFADKVGTPVKSTFTSVKGSISNAFTNAKTAVTTAWSPVKTWFGNNVTTPVKYTFASVKTSISCAFTDAKKAVTTAWGSVPTWFQNNVVNPVKRMFQTIWDTLTGLFNGKITFNDLVGAIGDAFKSFINQLIRGMNQLLSKVVSPINSMISKIKWIKVFGKYPFKSLTTFAVPSIPYLAKGAVIPPNAPFMAMLGDQKRGTNIEAPLETIKQAVSEVVGRGGGNTYHVSVNCEQKKLLEIIINEAELWQMQTGSNPFELVY